jgi:hypothetical protein
MQAPDGRACNLLSSAKGVTIVLLLVIVLVLALLLGS